MLKTALQPRFLALLGLVLVVAVLFTRLGMWQLNVSQHKDDKAVVERTTAAPEEPVDAILPPQTPITGDALGRAVSATGRYDGAHQVRIVDRRLDGRLGSWVVTPLVVDSSGARLAVVRGFVEATGPLPPAPTGPVTVHGSLQAQEGPPDEPRAMPTGHMQSVDVSSLVNTWGGDVYNAFVFAGREDPAPTGAAARLTRIPPPPPQVAGEIDWRNFAYAIQWWIFAAFGVYLWWRMVRDEHLLATAADRAEESAPAADDRPTTVTPSGGTTP